MAFQEKTDYFGLATSGSGLVITDSNDNNAAQVAQGQNEKGDIVAYEVFGEQKSPTCTYILESDVALSGLTLGQPITGAAGTFAYGSINITTAAGQPPSIEVTGEQVPSDTSHTDCYYDVPTATLEVCHHAQDVFNVLPSLASGCYLTAANYTIGGDLTKATKDGVVKAFDIANGQVTMEITIQQTGSTKPSLTTAGLLDSSNWTVTGPLTCVNADSQLPTWNATISRVLTHHTGS